MNTIPRTLSAPASTLLLWGFPLLFLGISICVGRYSLPVEDILAVFGLSAGEVKDVARTVILNIRLPRSLAALLVGAGLSVSGAAFQGLFRNPLVGPSILGVAQGAGFGAALGLLLGGSMLTVNGLAFAFGIGAVTCACFIANRRGGRSLLMLVLAGIVMGAVFTALISLIKYTADPEDKLPTIVYWLMGGLSGVGYRDLLFAAPVIGVGAASLHALRWRINVLSLGDEVARSFGELSPQLAWPWPGSSAGSDCWCRTWHACFSARTTPP